MPIFCGVVDSTSIQEDSFGKYLTCEVPLALTTASTILVYIVFISQTGDLDAFGDDVSKRWSITPLVGGSEQITLPTPHFPNYSVNAVTTLNAGEHTIQATMYAEKSIVDLEDLSPAIYITVMVGEDTGHNNIVIGSTG